MQKTTLTSTARDAGQKKVKHGPAYLAALKWNLTRANTPERRAGCSPTSDTVFGKEVAK